MRTGWPGQAFNTGSHSDEYVLIWCKFKFLPLMRSWVYALETKTPASWSPTLTALHSGCVLGGLSTPWRCSGLHHTGGQIFKISLTKSRTTGVELTRIVDCLYEDLLSNRKRRAAVWQELVLSVRLTFSVRREIAVVGDSKMYCSHLAAVTFPDSWLHKPFWTQTQIILTLTFPPLSRSWLLGVTD